MDVSIIIPLFNRLDLTRLCLDSLAQTTRRVRCEVILVDDGSTDGTREFLRDIESPTRRIVLNAEPRGYAANNNAAARLARAPVLCLLNNDTCLLPGWLEPMLRVLSRARRAGCVGNVQREPLSGLIDHIGVHFNADGNPIHMGKDSAAPPTERYSRWPAVTAACCVVRREVYEKLGGLDEGFRNGFEDVDFCLRAGAAGFAHYTANRSVIYHHVSASPGRHAREEENLARYRSLWGDRVSAFLELREAERLAEIARSQTSVSTEEERRVRRQAALDVRAEGYRYLRKHLLRPWRYNYGRLSTALVKVSQPLPAPFLRSREPWEDAERLVSEATLFDPPRQ